MAIEYAATTIVGRTKFAKAHRGDITLPALTDVAFGDGGHDPVTGEPIPPIESLAAVPGEFIRKPIASSNFPVPTTLNIVGILGLDEGVGKYVSAFGIYDSDGDLILVKTFTAKGKDLDMEMEINWNEEF